ncbi:uncharacterized protein EV420DRAFT_1642575 [Desarmillaria tabescens]|uniref:Heterokaryon incompatibility domain-containing protein n=1 Tax=Armillaria tabescens TaxID=1929756 RepID=A0AA39N644_ARMTA|nr:uncharacterized protein EV420DRAFT_1642575 [Desarmillaria tabescens]KAK0458853.1 hypothetical protein EV420DRAFT_1642575 [Desarmillaria tabescens]
MASQQRDVDLEPHTPSLRLLRQLKIHLLTHHLRNLGFNQRLNISLPEVTISAFTETGQEGSSVIVPLQRAYTGTEPVISSCLADTPCATLGVQALLDQLNTTLRTSRTVDTTSLSSLLEDCIANNYDFGMAYGRLRRVWYTRNWSTIRNTLRKWEEGDREKRRKALVGNQVVEPLLEPRRIWDLYSNRVVPWWSTGISFDHSRSDIESKHQPRPISHAWMDEKDRVNVSTPINGYEWPVPIPKDTSLNLVRIEMLNLGLEYVWLDVLCLRQVGGPGENMRTEEWMLDVPTIGAVYLLADVVWYLSGLGRPLSLKDGDLDSDRSWFRRAWTLQEVSGKMVIAGDTWDGPLHAKEQDGKYETPLLTRFHEQLQSESNSHDISNGVFAVLENMRKRVSTNPVDKVAGLAFRLLSNVIPAYYESQSLEEAWTALVNSMDAQCRADLFSFYPEPGNAGAKWRPSWHQLMTKPLPTDAFAGIFFDRDEETGVDWCEVECIKGLVRGLAVVEGDNRHGQLIVKGKDGMKHRFKIMATHTYPIPAETYTLICVDESDFRSWVVGRRLPKQRFEKVSVLQILDRDESTQLKDLHITEECLIIPV